MSVSPSLRLSVSLSFLAMAIIATGAHADFPPLDQLKPTAGLPDVLTMLDLFASDPQYAQVTDVVERVGGMPPTSFAKFVRDFAEVFRGAEAAVQMA